MRPATDLCWYCQKGVTKLARSANLPDSEKSAAPREYEEHLRRATMERACYTDVCKDVKDNLPHDLLLRQNVPCSYPGKCHYSFDFAQQVHFPSDPLQPGPIYFKCPRKCGLFGIECEPFPRQVKVGSGECHLHLHADNCSGQNKNSCMMRYLMWRVLTGRHRSICLSC